MASHYLVVSGELYARTFPERVVVVRVHEADPQPRKHPYALAITTPVSGYVLPDLIEWLPSEAVQAGSLLGAIDPEVMATVNRLLRGILELP
ncbi:MAG: hypothetical protein ACRDTU_09960 [Micromonosporaceae bacterium]